MGYFARSVAVAEIDSEGVPQLADWQDFNLNPLEEFNGIQPEPAVLTAPAPPERISVLNHYHPCHIQLPHTEQCCFAIAVDGEFYSLLKLALTEEDTLAIAHHVRAKTDRKVVITKTNQGYAVWIWESDARLQIE
jgi:hypothetical protein